MKRFVSIVQGLWWSLALSLSACSQPVHAPEYIDQKWSKDSIWDQGLAEVAEYESIRIIYGQPRSYTQTVISVKEDFSKQYNAKTTDYDRSDLFEVIKQIQMATIETENYPYQYFASSFVLRQAPGHLHKSQVSSQEWCGTTFKLIRRKGRSLHAQYHSYWHAEGSATQRLPKNSWTEEQLPLTLRALAFEDGLTFKPPLAFGLLSNKANFQVDEEAKFMVRDAGSDWSVEVSFGNGMLNTYTFDQEFPHVLTHFQSSDGRQWTLTSVKWDAYWEH